MRQSQHYETNDCEIKFAHIKSQQKHTNRDHKEDKYKCTKCDKNYKEIVCYINRY